MIHFLPIVGLMRYFDAEAPIYGAHADAALLVQFETPKTVFVSIFKASQSKPPTRKLLRETVLHLAEKGVDRMKSAPELGALLPMSHLQHDGTYFSQVSELIEFCARDDRRHTPAPQPVKGQQRRRGEAEWQDTVPSRSHELENHVRPKDAPQIEPEWPAPTPPTERN